MDKVDLANAYLFDELIENDKDIKTSIAESKLDTEDVKQLLMGELILLKSFILEGKKTETSKLTEQIEETLKLNEMNRALRGIQIAFDATKFQMELMTLIK